jgi:flagellar biosynthetic protein FlhB
MRIFTTRNFVHFGFGILKVCALLIVLYTTLRNESTNLVNLVDMGFGDVIAYLTTLAFRLAFRAAIVLLILAILDYGYQYWQYERDIRMSRTELREEMRRLEGDPRMRERRRALYRQLVMQKMLAAVPKASVVITNPTELAIALSYEADMNAPKVLAKGAGFIAEKIRSIAREHGIPIVEKPTLAQALYKTVEVGQEIPAKFYAAVAEVLAYIYSLNKKQKSFVAT